MDVWDEFLRICTSVYVWFPDFVATYQGRKFISAEWKTILRSSVINPKFFRVEIHNALGVG